MSTVYALLIGIDDYRAVPPLSGCVNDVRAARAYLRSRVDRDHLRAVELHDRQATRDAVIDGIRGHLGRAGAGDSALLWFSGHGSVAAAPPEVWHLEPDGRLQTLVCADSREGEVPDLYDKELSVLLDRVASAGAHVAAVLDNCHAAGVVRAVPEPAARVRRVAPAARVLAADRLIPELRAGWSALPDRGRLVALTACRSDQPANELPVNGGEARGLFSWALLDALNQLGPGATYRELLAAARCSVENRVRFQVPQLAGDEPADQPFLGGRLRAPASGITMRSVERRWEIDAGSCHGVPPETAGPARVAVAGDGPVRAARVVSVLVDRSVVEPDGWTPDPGRQFQVVFTRLPRPAQALAVEVRGEAAEQLGRAAAGSPWLRRTGPDERVVPDLRVVAPGPGLMRVLGSDRSALAPDIADDDSVRLARRTIRVGERIARWRHVEALTNPASAIAGSVRVELVAAQPGDRGAPEDRPALRAGADGVYRLRYRVERGVLVPPTVFVRLHNTTARPLYCVLLNLTGRYRIHATLFPGAFLGAHRRGAALAGRPVQFSLPAGQAPGPGASTQDRLKLIVAEEEFSGRPFEQDALDGAGSRGVPGPVAMTRDAGAGPDDPYDWATAVLSVVTEVPI
ncbi:caspase domain-containing protein [Actinoplanes sp. NPDC049265]|uniref:caspase family protein n=1 Tax=Actinoplanes sp. NPDC049265 TaxID=3363902 RepID=UPI00370FA641